MFNLKADSTGLGNDPTRRRRLTKVVATRPLTGDQSQIIGRAVPGTALVCAGNRDELISALCCAEVLFSAWGGVDLDEDIVRAATDLKWIHVGSTGVEHVLIPEVVESDIIVTSSRTVHAVPVAEHALAMLFALAKNIHAYQRDRLSRSWRRYTSPLVEGRTIGIIGYGAIGRQVAARARALGMRVLAVRNRAESSAAPVGGDTGGCLKPAAHNSDESQATPGAPRECGRTSCPDRVYGVGHLHEALAASDYVVICLPLTPGTRNLIGEREISAMKHGAHLINVSRGGIVDEDALAGALRDGALDGAAFDVFREEPLPPDNPLWELDNLIITPHVAGSRPDHRTALAEHLAENLRRWVAGEDLIDVVDKRRGY